MLKIFKKFFDFCGKVNKGKFYKSLALGVLFALMEALKIPAIILLLDGVIRNKVTSVLLWQCFGILLLSVVIGSVIKYHITMLQCEAGYYTAAGKRVEIAEHMRYLPMGYFNQNSLGQIYSEVLPEDKAGYVEMEKASGRRVLMMGDGVNDSPALSAADAGIAICDGAELAREIADITIAADDLYEIVRLKYLSNALMKRINQNYRRIVGFNTTLILLGVGGILQPTTSAMLHNASTLLISLDGMRDL